MPANNQTEKNEVNMFAQMEEEVLEFWDRSKTFQRSVDKIAPQGDYVFYDGPPFGTGEPHYGHLLSSISKDVIPRYFTMNGYRVERRWGWDCHGLPIENIIEKQMNISGKKQIEAIGVDKFNESARSQVLKYAEVWDVMIRRIGRWVEFKNSYKTMDLDFMESVWWGFKEMWKKDLVYQGRKVQLYCPRCETPIANFEVAMDNSYKDITETSVYVKFKLKDPTNIQIDYKFTNTDNIYILAWTTTPWTLPGNVALAVGGDIDYVAIKISDPKLQIPSYFILAKERLEIIKEEYEVIQEIKGRDLEGLEYEPLFDVPPIRESGKKAHYIAPADFVTTEDGTGVVHTAVMYGEDDFNLGVKLDLPIVPALDEKGIFNANVPQFQGVYFKAADKMIIADLEKRGLVYMTESTTHSYPFCHRCETQLFYNAIPAWFIAVSKLKQRMLELNQKINWFPAYLKDGRFALGIDQAPDWNISRNRYFGTPIPVWQCDKCGQNEVIGSVAELKTKSGIANINDIHIHKIDHLTWACDKCDPSASSGQGTMHRISEVLDCWIESGSMSFAQMHYPFENKEKFEVNFPAQYISEYISQTRAWFYVMHVIATAIFDSNSYENVIATGIILNEKGQKMSKSKKNYPDPWKVINEFGVDALRLYLMGSSVMQAENLFFNERELRDVYRKNIMLLWNVFKFYEMYADEEHAAPAAEPRTDNILDRWILSRLNQLIKTVTDNMNGYNLPAAARPLSEFINDLSTWYVRRSRDRFKSDIEKERHLAVDTTGYVLRQLATVMAPFMPFSAERVWQNVTANNFKLESESVHLENWPVAGQIDGGLLTEMEKTMKLIELGLAGRDEAGIKIRQRLADVYFNTEPQAEEFAALIKDELNVQNVHFDPSFDKPVKWNTELTPELIADGIRRELVRNINSMRKKSGMTIKDRVIIHWESESAEIQQVFNNLSAEIKKDTLSDGTINQIIANLEIKEMLEINGLKLELGLKKK